MLFNSIEFAIFLPIVFLLYWFVADKSLKIQNALLLVTSYVFYGWWDFRFLGLILFSSSVDYFLGIGFLKVLNRNVRKLLLLCSLIVNLGLLGVFKYYNFFVESFIDAFAFFKVHLDFSILNIILPVGISFYTFQTLSYSIDVYKGKLKPTNDIISFFAFVSFFPQLVAGPIERATHLLPQFQKKRKFVYAKAVDGMRQILWGLFKKIVIADNCAPLVNQIFENYEGLSGSTLFVGAILFAFQIYGDFSGYSDIAIGVARLFGFNLLPNFRFPYFSRDMAEFWRRWHISLNTWFRDYLYIPLGGGRGSIYFKIRNIFIVFTISGFWHGANWTFIAWGFLNACYFLPTLIVDNNSRKMRDVSFDKKWSSLKEFFQMAGTFVLTVFAWIFFRSETVTSAFGYISRIMSSTFFSLPQILTRTILFLLVFFVAIEWFGREGEYAISKLNFNKFFRWLFYLGLILIIYFFGNFAEKIEFIYFQF